MKALLMAISLCVAVVSAGFLMGSDQRAPSTHAWVPMSSADCRRCHDDSRGAADAPPMRSPFNHAPAAKVSTTSTGGEPEIVVINQLAQHYGPVEFDHRIHADMSELTGGCTNCHHNMAPGEKVKTCRECHSITRNGGSLVQPSLKGAYHRQCLGCHRDWSHENACGYCHREQTARPDITYAVDATDIILSSHPRIDPARSYVYQTEYHAAPLVSFHHVDHVQSFGLKCVDCHQAGSCARCHDGNGHAQPRDPVNRMSSCRSCHASNECNFCHDQQSRPAFDHARVTGWDLQPRHADVSCVACHGRVEAFLTPSSNCRACHGGLSAESFDHSITGVPLIGSHAKFSCGRCHVDSRADSPATCGGCHAGKSYPAQLPGRRL